MDGLEGLLSTKKQNNWTEWPQILTGQEAVAAAIKKEGTAQAVCDGLYMPNVNRDLGMASWVIQCTQSEAHCQGVIQTAGEADDVNAYWSELQGIHKCLMVIQAVCELHDITHGHIKLGCDNEKVISLASNGFLQPPLWAKHIDLVWAIRKLVDLIPVDINFQHIGGHQDNDIPFHHLDQMAQLNVWMDSEAKRYLQYLISLPFVPPKPSTIYKEGWSCWVHGIKATTDPSECID